MTPGGRLEGIASALETRPHPGWWVASWGRLPAHQTRDQWAACQDPVECTPVHAVGGRQLSLFHAAGGKTPAFAATASHAVVFDGMLYDRQSLRKEVTDRRNGEFNDAEILLLAYQRWGENFLDKIKGIFALLIWDDRNDLFLCVRDPMGVYPVFYADTEHELLVSTSTQALLQNANVPRKVNRLVLAEHLSNRCLSSHETYHESVSRLPSGHLLRETKRNRKVDRYWDPFPVDSPIPWVEEDELDQFDVLFEQAVSRCLELGSAGIYLSGGLDSVSVASVAADHCRRQGRPAPLALSLLLPHPDCDEAEVQNGVVDALGLPRISASIDEVVGAEGVFAAAVALSRSWPTPLLCQPLPAYGYLGHMGKREGRQVILTGSGGDEWMGVSPFLAADSLRTLNLGRLYHLWKSLYDSHHLFLTMFSPHLLWNYGLRPLVATPIKRAWNKVTPSSLHAYRAWRVSHSIPRWVAPDPELRREVIERGVAVEERSARLISRLGSYYALALRQLLDHPLSMLEMDELFELGQRVGVRILHPFWDADLVRFLYRVPPEALNRGRRTKAFVREMLARRFPELGFAGQKKVLPTAYFESITMEEGPKLWKSMNGTPHLTELGLVDESALRPRIAAALAGRKPKKSSILWQVLNTEAWLGGCKPSLKEKKHDRKSE